MIKHFNLKLNHSHGEKLEINNIIIGDLQSTIISLLNRNTLLSEELTPTILKDFFNSGGKY